MSCIPCTVYTCMYVAVEEQKRYSYCNKWFLCHPSEKLLLLFMISSHKYGSFLWKWTHNIHWKYIIARIYNVNTYANIPIGLYCVMYLMYNVRIYMYTIIHTHTCTHRTLNSLWKVSCLGCCCLVFMIWLIYSCMYLRPSEKLWACTCIRWAEQDEERTHSQHVSG